MPALLALALAQATMPQACTGGLCGADRLRPFLVRLAGARGAGRPVRILQIGDSHTAGDQITGAWRTLLQTRYGGAGRGALAPGRPYPGYLTRGITAAQSPGWTVNGIFGTAYRGAGAPPLGLGGYSVTSAVPGASIGLAADPGELFDRLTVCAIARPGAGVLRLTVGSASVDWSLAADAEEPRCTRLASDAPTGTAAVSVVAGPVTITSWGTERADAGGIVLSNLGTVGAQLTHFDRTDDRVVAAELDAYRPDLIVVAFGTNEAFRPGFSAAGYEAALRASLARLRRLAPGVPMLMLGAPDSGTRIATLQAGEAGVGAPCPAAGAGAAPTPLGSPDDGSAPLPAIGETNPWRPTAALAVVQSIQRREAAHFGMAFWDWSLRMGGRCTAQRWATAMPPMMRGDHVHFTSQGGAAIASLLQADLDAAMAATIAPPDAPADR